MLRGLIGGLVLLWLVPTSAEGEELWAGHQVVKGARSVPILGTLETRSDSYYLATVERKDGEILIVQKTCKLEIARFAGVKVSFLPDGVQKMPSSKVEYRRKGEKWEAGPWVTEWDTEDVDEDGKPGATIKVEAPVCGGTIFVSGFSKAVAKGIEKERGLEGEIRARVGHDVLGTSDGCIKLVAKGSEENVVGTFAYLPVPAGSTCESLAAGDWPAKAPAPDLAQESKTQKAKPKIR